MFNYINERVDFRRKGFTTPITIFPTRDKQSPTGHIAKGQMKIMIVSHVPLLILIVLFKQGQTREWASTRQTISQCVCVCVHVCVVEEKQPQAEAQMKLVPSRLARHQSSKQGALGQNGRIDDSPT